jgi:hypothetical protein
MKRCPTCNRTFLDDAQKFCLDDGTTLIEENAPSFDPQATLAMPGAQPTTPPSTPYGSGAGQSSPGSGAGQGSFGSGSGQGGFGSGSGQGGFGSGQGQQAGAWSPTPGQSAAGASRPAKKSILPWVLGGAAVLVVGVIGLIVILAIAFSGSSNSNSNRSNTNSSTPYTSSPTNVIVKSTDGKIQVSVPPAWKVTTGLNDKADLQVADRSNELYLIVLTQTKADYADVDIERQASGTLDSLTKAMTTSNRIGPTRLTIDGHPAVQYEVRGEINNLKPVYLHTTIETPNNFQQIVTWTFQSTYAEREDMLKGIIQSFKEN